MKIEESKMPTGINGLCKNIEEAKALLPIDAEQEGNKEWPILERYVEPEKEGGPIVMVRYYRATGTFKIGTKPHRHEGKDYLAVDENENFGAPPKVEISKNQKGETVIEGEDGEKIVFENVEGKPNEKAVLPEEILQALGLKLKWRMVGVALEHKIPLYETEKGMATDDYMNKATTKLYISRYDLISSPPKNLVFTKQWCLYIEREINEKHYIGGCFIKESVVDYKDAESIKQAVREIDKVLTKKYASE